MPDPFASLTKRTRGISSPLRRWGHGTNGVEPTLSQVGGNRTIDTGGRQVTLSEGHPWHTRNKRDMQDIGGPFSTVRTYYTDKPGGQPRNLEDFPIRRGQSLNWPNAGSYAFVGPALPVLPENDLDKYFQQKVLPFVEYGPRSVASLEAMGTKAVSLTKPTNSIADLSVTLAELKREGLPDRPGATLSSWEGRTQLAKSAGSEYLNYVFGWAPLVGEVQNLAKAVIQSEKIWKQYQRDAGRVVRRKFEFPVEKTTETSYSTGILSPNGPTQVYARYNGDLTMVRRVERKTWFEGAFTYYLPKLGEDSTAMTRFAHAAARARHLYGVTLDPEVLWNLTPWSWAIDWFVNAGDIISNLTDMATDGLVLRYGYVMEHVTITDSFRLQGCRFRAGDDISDLRLTYAYESKRRLRATPYGFGLTFEDFSPRQIAILAALGVTLGR